jgi:hypothetical protein
MKRISPPAARTLSPYPGPRNIRRISRDSRPLPNREENEEREREEPCGIKRYPFSHPPPLSRGGGRSYRWLRDGWQIPTLSPTQGFPSGPCYFLECFTPFLRHRFYPLFAFPDFFALSISPENARTASRRLLFIGSGRVRGLCRSKSRT